MLQREVGGSSLASSAKSSCRWAADKRFCAQGQDMMSLLPGWQSHSRTLRVSSRVGKDADVGLAW